MSTFIDDYEAGYAAGEKVGYEVGVKETDEYDAYQHGYATGFFKGYMSAKKEYEPKHGRWDTCGLTENSVLVDSGARGERMDGGEND